MIRRLAASWRARAAVFGTSMAPTLLPGDWLLVDPAAFDARPPRVGELVVAVDPRAPERLLVKRVAEVTNDRHVVVHGDGDASTDSRVFGALPLGDIVGRAWWRYWPPRRFGPLR